MTMLMLLGQTTAARSADAQLGALVSPGRLSRAHSSLEGIANCLSCHTAGQGVAAPKCLSCHKPVAERIAQKKGVHRNVTTDCVSCHVEHAGLDAELRPFDTRKFNHTTETGFPLDGLHAPLAATCTSCHKTRSFLAAKADCASCHADAHKGALGNRCASCHSTTVKFTDSRRTFDHRRTAFPLTGAHTTVGCVACHRDSRTYKGVQFSSCASCHSDPHEPRFPAACSSCHTTQGWRTTKVDHARTAFPLRGRHATVECAQCHVQPATKVAPRFDTCAACHSDPHRGTFKQDCASCHNETSWRTGTFDHSTTRFPLVDKHAGLSCASCHQSATSASLAAPPRGSTPAPARGTTRGPGPGRGPIAAPARAVDFRGLRTECVACHADVHEGKLGVRCETCHSARSFDVPSFNHARPRALFAGVHAALTCAQCHAPVRPSNALPAGRSATPPRSAVPRMARVGLAKTSDACVSCHSDVHAGQVSTRCEACHSLDRPKFAVTSFAHEKTRFPLTGKHVGLECATCHRVETRTFPAGTATTRRLTGIGTDCVACHQDPHAGQFKVGCQSCHSVETFTIARYTHLRARALGSFFVGRHVTACSACHKPAAARSVQAAVVAYQIPTTCTACHTDIHRGALGPRCETCHKP
jgi:predicted CXXCH cytochrome family protein